MAKSKTITVETFEIVLYAQNNEDFISLTDMARYRDSERTNYIIQNWLRTRIAIEFCGLWEQINNPNFKRIEFDAFRNDSGSNSFTLTPQKWIEATDATGMPKKLRRGFPPLRSYRKTESLLIALRQNSDHGEK